MRWSCGVMLTALLLSGAALKAASPEVDQAEVLRLGDVVQYVGSGPRASADTDAYVEAMGPPASDADKWFISVLSTRGCTACKRLAKDWATSPWLLAIADPNDPKHSWAHYNIYDKDDRSQSFRFEAVQVSAYPTILVQPPRSGRYGDSSTVVFQGVYSGDPQKLARDIAQAIRQYVGKFPAATSATLSAQGQYSADAPWQPAPKPDPWQPQPTPTLPAFDPTIPPPTPTPAPSFPWSSVLSLLLTGFSVPAAVAIGAWLVTYIRARRLAAGKTPIIDPAMLDRILEMLKQLVENPPKQPVNKT